MSLVAIIATAVGLASDADEKTVISSFEGVVVDLLSATGAKNLKQAAANAETQREAHDAFKAKAEKADEYRAELDALKAANEKAELDSLISNAVKSGRLAPARKEAFAAKAAKFGAEWAKATIEELPVLVSGDPLPVPPPKPTEAEIDAETLKALEAVGLGAEHFKAAQSRGHV